MTTSQAIPVDYEPEFGDEAATLDPGAVAQAQARVDSQARARLDDDIAKEQRDRMYFGGRQNIVPPPSYDAFLSHHIGQPYDPLPLREEYRGPTLGIFANMPKPLSDMYTWQDPSVEEPYAISPRDPTSRERVDEFLRGDNRSVSRAQFASKMMSLLDWTPVGSALNAYDAYQAGDPIGMGLSALGVIPTIGTAERGAVAREQAARRGLGDMLRGERNAAHALERNSPMTYDAPNLRVQTIQEAYGGTVPVSDANGRLIYDRDQRPIDPNAIIVGFGDAT